MNAHGVDNIRSHIFGNNTGYEYHHSDGKTYRDVIIPYADLVNVFSGVKGRAVIVFESCFSGNAVTEAKACIDPDRMVILSSVTSGMTSGTYPNIGWFANDLRILARRPLTTPLGLHELLFVDDPDYSLWNTETYEVGLDDQSDDKVKYADVIEYQSDDVVTVGEAYAAEDQRRNYIGLYPQGYGNSALPLFVLTEEYDDGIFLFCVKNEEYHEYPPVAWGEVVFSYDPKYSWVGTVTMYVLDGDGRLVEEASEAPENWVFRTRLTDDNFGYRPAPLSQAGGINTRLLAIRLSNSLVLTEWDTGFVAAGPNAPRESSTYSVWRVDPTQGVELVLQGTFNATYDKTAYRGDLQPVSAGYRLNGLACTEDEFLSAFAEYEIGFWYSILAVTGNMRESFLTAYSTDGEVLLAEIRSDAEAPLPPTYDGLVAAHGLAAPPES